MQHDPAMDMVQHEFQVGAITITVEAPKGVPVAGVGVDVHPPDRETFLRSMEAAGGLEAMVLPEHERGYEQAAFAYPPGPGGEPNFAVSVAIKEPPREKQQGGLPPHPFFGPLAERAERERTEPEAAEEPAGEPA